MAPNDPPPAWKVAGVVGFYMTVALVMVMTNKWVLSTSSLPLTFLLLQLSTSVLLLHLLPLCYDYVPPRWTRSTILAVLPVSIVNVVGLMFNIYCLKLVDASYFQVARGLTLPMTVVLQALMNGMRPSAWTIGACGLVMWGFTYSFLPIPGLSPTPTVDIYGVMEDTRRMEAPMAGMMLGVASAAMVAVHAILVKQALKKVEGHTLDLAYWQNALSALALIPGIIFSGEIGDFVDMVIGKEGDGRAFIIGSGVTGVVGFLICLAGLLSIKVTSPVTHMFSSAMRSVLQTMLGVYIFGDILNASRIMSIVLIIIGSCVYTWNQSRGSLPKSPVQEDRKRLLTGQEKTSYNYAADPEKGERKD
ncbi:hypothetical protein L486_07825 [Kwoniella mangroviensis CBS 10435]|uniref:GDP-mannose transporter n=1 Tax=Kwoniella mangroviensis CBS 10435 TaxID=1331196 RepID=A0A1B9IGX1_9TREE|nr:hypothetical protein L486_07825 [Kwoniella mangroviensis CBS 10435]OCF78681.1 hypothetical protein I204_00623 [Kwoniella mangroviensis CBS 8886]